MTDVTGPTSDLKLSICLTTRNRARFLRETLESILGQMTNDCEIVVVDGASTDETEVIMREYERQFHCCRYIRQETNSGLDSGYDQAVELANGEFCWLMADDDLLVPGAVASILETLRSTVSMVILNVEERDFSMSTVLQRRWLKFNSNRVYGPGEMDRLFVEVGNVFMYIGCVVIRRAVWLTRERTAYYGSWYIHVGIIFQKPLPGDTVVIAPPLISYRVGNGHTFSPRMGEVIFEKWPSLVAALPLSMSAKRKVASTRPAGNFWWLLMLRGAGVYSVTEYRRWILSEPGSMRELLIGTLVILVPGSLLNSLFLVYLSVTDCQFRGVWLQFMTASRFNWRNWRVFKRSE